MSRVLILLFFASAGLRLFPQIQFAYGGSNYGGVQQIHSNPALLAGSKLKLDVVVAGYEVTFNNSWLAIKKEAVSFPKLPSSWRNFTPNVENNIYKNFVPQQGTKSREAVLDQRLLLPSIMWRLDERNTFAFSSSMRQLGNITGISAELAELFEKEFILGVLQNNPVQNKDFRAIRMTWMSYGLTWSIAVVNKNQFKLKAGVTVKALQGLESAYFIMKDLDFLFSNKDTLSYLRADFTTAHTRRAGFILDITDQAGQKLGRGTHFSPGFDLGLSVEWKPVPVQAVTAGKGEPSRRTTIPYRIRAGVSVMDIGRLKFDKQRNYYEMRMSITQHDIIRYIAAENVQMIDSLLRHDFPANTGEQSFKVKMPTAINAQVDVCITPRLFANLSAHFTPFYRSTYYKVSDYSAISLAPRFESYWLDVSLPLTWHAVSALRRENLIPGLSLRAGPLTVGTYDLTFLFKKEVAAVNLFFLLRVSIPHKADKMTGKK